MVRIGDIDRFVFIVGAPRCGTTTLSHFLKAHPAVSSPVVKEPHFFAQNDLRRVPDAELRSRIEGEYLRRFFRPDPSRSVAMDASVTYLYTPEQLEPILHLWPNSRFIVTLRDPLTMLPSLHKRLIYIGDETIVQFDKAWAAVPARRQGKRVPRRCADPRWLLYDEAARFSTYLERLFATVGRERCLVLLFDDLVADPARQYRRLMAFAGLERVPWTDFSARRSSYGVRSRFLQRILKRPPAAMRNFFAGEEFQERIRDLNADPSSPTRTLLSLRKRLLRWNRIAAPSEPLKPGLRREICRTFEGEIDRLGTLLGRDLSHWCRAEPPMDAPDGNLRQVAESTRTAAASR